MTMVECNTDMDRVLMGNTREFKVKMPLNGCKLCNENEPYFFCVLISENELNIGLVHFITHIRLEYFQLIQSSTSYSGLHA
jgi:hypothetical protein